MNITIEAKNHKNHNEAVAYYQSDIKNKYSDFAFIQSVHVNVSSKEKDLIKVSLHFSNRLGSDLYSSATSKNEEDAFKNAKSKMDTQLSKFKTKHYQGIHKS